MDLAQGQIGSEASYDVKLTNGKLVLTASYAGLEAGASVSVSVEPGLFLDKLKAVIPGQIDDAVIELLKNALKAL